MLKKLYNLKEINPKFFIVSLLIMLNLTIAVFTAFLAWIFGEGQFTDPWDAFWKLSLEWLLDAGFYDNNQTPILRAFSVIFIVTSMVTLNGGIVAFLSSFLAEFFSSIRSGRGRVKVSNHILILGWNDKGAEIVNNFLYDTDIPTLVVLSLKPKEEILTIIEKTIDKTKLQKTKIEIIILNGDPTSKQDLNRSCYQKAKGIIVLNPNQVHNKIISDIEVMKVSFILASSKLVNTNFVIDIKNEESENLLKKFIEKSDSFKPQNWVFLNEQKIIGNMLFQALVLPGLTPIYHEIMSFEGSDLNPIKIEHYSFEDYLSTYSESIPLFEATYPGQEKYLLVLSNSLKSLNKKYHKKIKLNRIDLKPSNSKSSDNINNLIIGKNAKLQIIEDSVINFEKENNIKIGLLVHENMSNHTKQILQDQNFDHILFLSSESSLNEESPDSETLMNIAQTIYIKKNQESKMIVEVTNNRNLRVLNDIGVKFSLLSNRYVSRIISQSSVNPVYYDFIFDLITYDGNEDELDNSSYEFHATEAKYIIDFGNKESIFFDSTRDLIFSIYQIKPKDPIVVIGLLINEKKILNPYFFDKNLGDPITINQESILILIKK